MADDVIKFMSKEMRAEANRMLTKEEITAFRTGIKLAFIKIDQMKEDLFAQLDKVTLEPEKYE